MHLRFAAATAALALAVLAGCSEVEDAAQDVASDAACSTARAAVDEAGRQAGDAVDEIGADPAAAERELSGIRDALAAAENGLSGETKETIGRARTAVEKLLGQAEDAAQGVDVDTRAVDDARAELDQAVGDVRNLC